MHRVPHTKQKKRGIKAQMNKRLKAILLAAMVITAALLITSCSSSDDDSYYKDYDAEGYNVSVKFDANGGQFAPSVSTFVDTFKLNELPNGENGMKNLMILTPDDANRGKSNAFSVYKSSEYFFAGWYQEKKLIMETDDGEEIYSYSGKWDFSKPYSIDPDKSYTASEPVITLYAAWLPTFTVEYYDRASDSEEPLCTYTVLDPMKNKEVLLPTWNEKTGAMDYNSMMDGKQFGYTFSKAYYDKEGKQPIDGNSFQHIGSVIESNATATLSTMKIYVDRVEGTWFKISNASQLIENAGVSYCYEIMNDIDFTGYTWPEVLAKNTFNGKIIANEGCTISNIKVEQNAATNYYGVFGQVGSMATISNINFENVSVTINTGTNKKPGYYGLFAGMISENAVITNVSISGKLSVHSDFSPAGIPGDNSGKGNCVITLLGEGDTKNLSYANITFEVIDGENFDLTLTQDGNSIDMMQKAKTKPEDAE